MTLEFYKLKEQPFGSAPDARFLYMSSAHRDAVGALLRGLQSGRGFVTVIGAAGLGKTTLLFHTLNCFGNRVVTIYLFQAAQTPVDLLNAILGDMGAEARSDDPDEMLVQVTELLKEQHRRGRRVVVVLDEAQDLALPVLKLVKTLSRLETARGKLVQLILCGRPELTDDLAMTKNALLVQRVLPAVQLKAFSAEDTKLYVAHRLRLAGYEGETPLFTTEAGSLIARYSRGVPRTINTLCYHCLALGCRERRERIEGDLVREAAGALQLALPLSLVPQVVAIESLAPPPRQAGPSQPAAFRARSMPAQLAVKEAVESVEEGRASIVGFAQGGLPQRAAVEVPILSLPKARLPKIVTAQPAWIPPRVLALDEVVLGEPARTDRPLIVGARPRVLPEVPDTDEAPMQRPRQRYLPQVFAPRQGILLEAPVGVNEIAVFVQANDLQRAMAEDTVAMLRAGLPRLRGGAMPHCGSLQMETKRKGVAGVSQLLVTPERDGREDEGSGPCVPPDLDAGDLKLPQATVWNGVSHLNEEEPGAAFAVHSFPRLAITVILLLVIGGSGFAVHRAMTAHHGFVARRALPAALLTLRAPRAATVPLAEVQRVPVTASNLAGAAHELKGMDLSSALHALSGRSLRRICTINFGTCDSKHLDELRKVNPRLKDAD